MPAGVDDTNPLPSPWNITETNSTPLFCGDGVDGVLITDGVLATDFGADAVVEDFTGGAMPTPWLVAVVAASPDEILDD